MRNKSELVSHLVMIRALICTFAVVCIPLSCSSKSVITGSVKHAVKGFSLENVIVRIENSGFQTRTDKSGQFQLNYAPGNFTVVFECLGYMPKATSLSLTSGGTYPMGEIFLFVFPTLVDMYGKSLSDVQVEVRQATYSGSGAVLSQTNSDSTGKFLIRYQPGPIRLVASKPNYKTRSLICNFDQPQAGMQEQWMLPPEQPGIYFNGRYLQKSTFNFAKKGMSGLMIPAYYDGTYSVVSEPEIIEVDDKASLFWVPERAITIGENVFASGGGLVCYTVEGNGVFVRYDNGRGEGQSIPLKLETILNEVEAGYGGLVQQKIQIFRLEANLGLGDYVLFQAGGNPFDKEPHPEERTGCYYLKVVNKQLGGTSDDTIKQNNLAQIFSHGNYHFFSFCYLCPT